MTFLLFSGSVITFLIGILISSGAVSAIHQILAACCFISSAVQFSGGAITYTLNRRANRIEDLIAQPLPATFPTSHQGDPIIPQPEPERRDKPQHSTRSWVEEAREQQRQEQGAGR